MKNVIVVTLLLIVFRTLVAPQATNAQQIEIAEPGRRGSAAQRATHKSDPGALPIDGAVIYDHDAATNLGEDVFGNVICDFEKDAPGRNSHGHERHVLDVYTPEEPAKNNLPVMFWIHGGGWQKGDKSDVALKPKGL